MTNLVKAELQKIRTTSTWWIFGIILLPLWAAALLFNWAQSNLLVSNDETPGLDPNQAEQLRVAGKAVNIASDLYTSGQFFGVLIVMLLGAIVVTNEFFHLTATTTFLVSPRRETVVYAKLAAAAILGVVFWLVTSLLNLIFAPLILTKLGLGVQLGEGAVWRAIALNGLAFILWAVLGVGFGVLIRSQLAATITLALAYVVGTFGASIIFNLLSNVAAWTSKLQVLVPTTASALMISGTDLPGNPPRWVGAAVLVGYAAVTAVLGTMIMKRRDIA
ncbi:MAG: type transport system permease protein [Actinoplanes sp.]|jgi:ABC-type transport system involved in multi-copper enzyme maturation permease subunit|nr:type transport system permease protein [Actinoplanes sp.]